MTESCLLAVPYHDQETRYYCGPASVSMVIEYTSGEALSQDTLSDELETVTGTHSAYMDDPFYDRDFSIIQQEFMSLFRLKKRIASGYAPILLIWFDETCEEAHYVVAVGYNETGVFINDPWPTKWGPPVGRDTGPYVYLSNETLSKLWAASNNWALTVASSSDFESLHQVNISLTGLPEGLESPLNLNGDKIGSLSSGEYLPLMVTDESDFLSVDTTIQDQNGSKYLCANSLQMIKDNESIQFVYTQLTK
ncbi:MAG: C39 family peptidase [Candidatus Bathyarchaeota archaeon]|nr:C39 family peptidase [Candidatus Bathyarchaeota archaeon]